jgi:hypothetical protein
MRIGIITKYASILEIQEMLIINDPVSEMGIP